MAGILRAACIDGRYDATGEGWEGGVAVSASSGDQGRGVGDEGWAVPYMVQEVARFSSELDRAGEAQKLFQRALVIEEAEMKLYHVR